MTLTSLHQTLALSKQTSTSGRSAAVAERPTTAVQASWVYVGGAAGAAVCLCSTVCRLPLQTAHQRLNLGSQSKTAFEWAADSKTAPSLGAAGNSRVILSNCFLLSGLIPDHVGIARHDQAIHDVITSQIHSYLPTDIYPNCAAPKCVHSLRFAQAPTRTSIAPRT